MKRIAFHKRYNDIHNRWNIPKEEVDKLIEEANTQLIDEILDDTPLTISNFFRDNRTDHEYYYDLIDGRLVEDFIVLWFNSRGCKAQRSGADKDNKIQRSAGKKITTTADLIVNGINVEIQISRQGLRHKYHIKDTKAQKIKCGMNKLMFLVNENYIVVEAKDINENDIEYNYLWGGKKCYCVRPTQNDYKRLVDPIDWL